MAARPRQAVILAGGRGTRLRPMTDTLPKPMILFHGRPFLEYLVDHLRDQGFERILMLLGYLPDVITDYFGDGGKSGIRIDYDTTSVDDNTGTRLRKARDELEPHFLLLYCDNYWPMDFPDMWQKYEQSGAPAQVTVYDNTDDYTRSNLIIDDQGFVTVYDKSRTAKGLQGVDIGFFVLDRSVIDLLPSDGNPSFEAVVYPQLVAKKQLSAYVTGHRYYSVGSHERLHLTKDFLAWPKAVLIDRDGTLNQKMPKAQYVCSWDQWKWLPGAKEALVASTKAGYKNLIVTNQPGIARGELSLSDLDDIHARMKAEAENAGATIDAIYVCPHGWDEECACRKPKPGHLFQAQRDFHLDLSRLVFIGDDDRDGEAAAAARMEWVQVSEDYSVLAAMRDFLSRDNAA